MARKFHTTNGASVFRVNGDTVNYLYKTEGWGFLKNCT
jgi:hypothetical protein